VDDYHRRHESRSAPVRPDQVPADAQVLLLQLILGFMLVIELALL